MIGSPERNDRSPRSEARPERPSTPTGPSKSVGWDAVAPALTEPKYISIPKRRVRTMP